MEIPSFKEDHISQIPALQLLQNLGYKYLTPKEALQLRGNKTINVLLDDSKRFDIQVQLMSLAAQIDSRLETHPI